MKSLLRVALLSAVLFTCTSGAHAQSSLLTPAAFLPGDAAVGHAAGDQTDPAVAAGGGIFLAVWKDARAYPTGASSFYEYETAGDIYGMRFDAAGAPLDAVPFVVTQKQATQEHPQVSWNGTHFLVVFESTDVHGTGYYYQKSLEAVRVTPAGQVVDATPIKIRNVSPSGQDWAVGSDGVDWTIVFQTANSSSSAIKLLRVTASGTAIYPPRIIIPATYYSRYNFRLSFAGGVYLLTFTDFSDTAMLRFDSNYNLLDASPKTLVAGTSLSGVAASGTQFYAVWIQSPPPLYLPTVTGTRISTAGAVLDGVGVNISQNNSVQAYGVTDVAWDGAVFKATWAFNNAVAVARINPAGAVLDPGGIPVAGPSSGRTAASGGALRVVWSDYDSSRGKYEAQTAFISSAFTAGPNAFLGTGAPMQTRVDAATGPAGSMAVFESDIAGTNRILAQPLGLNGAPLTAGPVQLDSGPHANGPVAPSIAWNGTLYLATWSSATGIVGRRIAQDGSLLEAAPFAVMPGFGPTDTAASGSTFLVIGRQVLFNNPEYIAPFVSRVQGSGTVLDPAGINVGSSFCTSVSLTGAGTRWFGAWRSNATHDNPAGSTLGAFINLDGTHGPEFGIYGPNLVGGNAVNDIAVASDGTDMLVLQSNEVSSGVETDLIGVIVRGTGAVLAPVNLTPWAGNQYNERVAWNGTHYVVAWTDQRNRFALWTLDPLDARGDLFAMRVTPAGVPVDPQGFAFSLSAAAEAWANVTAGAGVTTIFGSVMRNAPFDAYRIGYQQYGAGGNAWPIVAAGANSTGGDTPLAVNFDSTGSTDPGGSIAAWLWNFGDGVTSNLPAPSHQYTVPGEYVVTLTVSDNQGAGSVGTAALNVRAPNVAPVAVAQVNLSTGPAPLSVILNADGSYDTDGAIGNYAWQFSDGGTYFGATAYWTIATPGVYTATVTAFDDRGGTGTSTVTINVVNPNTVPPLPPSNLTTWQVTGTLADIHWTDNATNETGFTLERCNGTLTACTANPALFTLRATPGANVTGFADTGLTPGTPYCWRIRAFNPQGSSAWANTLSVTTLTLPAAPTNLKAQAKLVGVNAKVRLQWVDNALDETGYTLERCKGATCTNFAAVAFLPADSVIYTDGSLARATTYRYRVTASGNGGNSPYSNIVKVTTP